MITTVQIKQKDKTFIISLPVGSTVANLQEELSSNIPYPFVLVRKNESGSEIVHHMIPASKNVTVVSPTQKADGYSIPIDMSLLELHKKFLIEHGVENKSGNSVNNDTIKFNVGTNIKFIKTLRVPNIPGDGTVYPLPPGLGSFPLAKVGNELILPMYKKEAMWMKFKTTEQMAIIVAIDNINVVSGTEYIPGMVGTPDISTSSSLKRLKLGKEAEEVEIVQNYIISSQPWLDGFNTGSGVVSQFVADSGESLYSMGKQVAGSKNPGTFTIECIPAFDSDFVVTGVPERWTPDKSASEVEMETGTTFSMSSIRYGLVDNILTDGDTLHIYPTRFTIHVSVVSTDINYDFEMGLDTKLEDLIKFHLEKVESNEKEGYERYASSQIVFNGKLLDSTRLLYESGLEEGSKVYVLSNIRGGGESEKSTIVVAGGRIKQNIHKDPKTYKWYDNSRSESVRVRLVGPEIWTELTGLAMPTSMIDMTTYEQAGIPWYRSYEEEGKEGVEESEALSTLKTLPSSWNPFDKTCTPPEILPASI